MPLCKNLTLELHQLPQEEVRRGWVRIHESQRGDIQGGELIEIKGPSGSVLRVAYGLPPGYHVGERTPEENWICMDEPTRDAIGLKDTTVGSMICICIKRIMGPLGWFQWVRYSLGHPEIPLKVSSWLAVILGGLSVVLGIISVILSVVLSRKP